MARGVGSFFVVLALVAFACSSDHESKNGDGGAGDGGKGGGSGAGVGGSTSGGQSGASGASGTGGAAGASGTAGSVGQGGAGSGGAGAGQGGAGEAGQNEGGAGTGGVGGEGGGGNPDAPLDGTWQPVEIVSENATDFTLVGLGACGDGDAILLWRRRTMAPVEELRASRFTASSGTWGSAVLVAEGEQLDNTTTQFAVGGGCDAIVTWADDEDANGSALTATVYDGSTFSAPAPISPRSTTIGPVRVAISDAGDAVVAYALPGDGNRMWTRRVDYVASAGFAQPVIVSDEARDTASIGLAMLGDGRAALVTREVTPAVIGVSSSLRTASGTWQPGPPMDPTLNSFDVLPAGDHFILRFWENAHAAFGTLDARALARLPFPADLPADGFTQGAGNAIAGNADVTFLAGRVSGGGATLTELEIAEHDGSTWSSAVLVASDAALGGVFGVVVDSASRAMAYDITTLGNVLANRYTPDTGWRRAMLVAPSSAGSASRIAVDPAGNVIIAWKAGIKPGESTTNHIVALRYVLD